MTNFNNYVSQFRGESLLVALVVCILAGIADPSWAADDWVLKGPHPWYAGRSNHAMGYAGDDNVVMFAGNAGPDIDDTCVYDLSADNWFCHYPVPRPAHRKDHAMAYIGDDKESISWKLNEKPTTEWAFS